MPLTITEALAEIKTIDKRLASKREFIGGLLWRQEALKDPLEKDGGSAEAIRRERQAITDLQTRVIALRRAIDVANDRTEVTIVGTARTIADWLVWRRDVVPGHKAHLASMRQALAGMRDQARRQNANVVTAGEAQRGSDVIVNISERDLAAEIEGLEDVLGQLDGQLSLKNATVILVGV
jgi:hypothetical protein